MSTPLTSSLDLPANSAEASKPARARKPLPTWAREPLLHFVVIGALLFAIDQFILSRADDPHLIVVGPEVDAEAVSVFKQARGREPNDAELRALHQVWLDNEVLYREGLSMNLDRGDDTIRQRVIFKALSVVDANVRLPHIDEKGLREWFEARHEKYDEPVRYDFEEAALSGDTSEAAVRSFVDALNSGTPGDAQAGLRAVQGPPARESGAELRRRFRQGARSGAAWNLARHEYPGWLACDEARRHHAREEGRLQDHARRGAAGLARRYRLRTAQASAVRALAKKYKIQFAHDKAKAK